MKHLGSSTSKFCVQLYFIFKIIFYVLKRDYVKAPSSEEEWNLISRDFERM